MADRYRSRRTRGELPGERDDGRTLGGHHQGGFEGVRGEEVGAPEVLLVQAQPNEQIMLLFF